MKATLIVNLFGGPGVGKSTIAADVFAQLKHGGHNVELVTEYVKRKVYEGSLNVLNDQIYVFGKQYHSLHILMGTVDIILCDSPLLNSCVYGKPTMDAEIYPSFEWFALNVFNSMSNANVLLVRAKPYVTVGRTQDEQAAMLVDRLVADYLRSRGIKHSLYPGVKESVSSIVGQIERVVR
jgi:Cdc6-like AAA superfamily ATPase